MECRGVYVSIDHASMSTSESAQSTETTDVGAQNWQWSHVIAQSRTDDLSMAFGIPIAGVLNFTNEIQN